ncbi:MEDS domain-containing protein [Methanosarcina horonobensis]
MGTNTRSSGIDVIGDIHWGAHLCQFYQTNEDLMDILVPYFKAGLKANEFCLWITSQSPYVEEAKETLRNSFPGIDVYLEKGQIEILPYTHWLLEEGISDLERLFEGWVEKLNEALANGYDGLRLTVNISWLEKENWSDFVNLEEKLGSLIEDYRIIALCTYFLDRCSAIEIIDIVANHQFSLIKRESIWEHIESHRRRKIEKKQLFAPYRTKKLRTQKLN